MDINELIKKATECKSNVKKTYKTNMTNKWAYYFAKSLVTKSDVTKIDIKEAPKPSHTNISRRRNIMVKNQY